MKTLLILALLVTLQSSIEYGKPEELKGLTKVFVDTNGDMQNRDRITKELSKLKLQLLDSAEGAEVLLDFQSGTGERLSGTVTNGTGAVATRRYHTGKGAAYVLRDGKRRVVMSYEGEEIKVWDDKPATEFGKAFAKAWKKANGVK